jgi:hypothetical protein
VIKSASSVLSTAVRASLGVISAPVQAGSLRNARDGLRAICARTSTRTPALGYPPPTPTTGGHPGQQTAALSRSGRSVVTIELPSRDSRASDRGG